MKATRLRTSSGDRPIGIGPQDTLRLGWNLPAGRQRAFRIQVARDPGVFTDLVWDSGRVKSPDSVAIPCEAALDSRTRYHWRVKVWTVEGTESEWSEPAWFECGLAPEDWNATPIAAPSTDGDIDPAPALRTSFDVEGEVERGRLYIATGGTHVARVNGERIGDRELDPAFTDYEERTLSVTHDVTDVLRTGENVLGFLLGRGRYAITTESSWGWQQAPWHRDRPTVVAQLEIEFSDGSIQTVSTDDGWEVTESATRFDSIFEGEHYDARKALDCWTDPNTSETGWKRAVPVDGPGGTFVPQVMQPMRAGEEVTPARITEPEDGVYVFDMGEMVAGRSRVKIDAQAGTRLTLTHAEKLDEEGFVDISQSHVNADIQIDEYVCAGTGTEIWEPQFSYHGFRYVQVEGLSEPPDSGLLTGVYAHSQLETGSKSDFWCDNDLLNRIHGNVRRGLLNNAHGLPTDSPMFEKNGWTGDVLVTAEATVYNFDAARFYVKWLDDCADAQRESGELPPIVPTSGWGYEGSSIGGMSGPLPGWDGAYVFLPWVLYRHYGDLRVLERHFDGMCRLVDFYTELSSTHIVDVGLGDWLPPGSGLTADTMKPPEGPAITSTGYFYGMATVVSKVAAVLERDEDARRYASLADEIRSAFHDRFWDADRGYYRTGEVDEYRQTSNVFPLAFDFVPEALEQNVVERLVEDVLETQDGHLNTGFHGTKYLLTTLAEYGYVDVAYTVASQDTYPSWGHWITENDATALYEAWELHSRSRDHPSFGSIDEFLYRSLAGIAPAEPGYQRVEIRPRIPQSLDYASATVDTVRGPVASTWERTDDGICLQIRIPGNAVGEVYAPNHDSLPEFTGNGAPEMAPTHTGTADGGSVWEVPPGVWSFNPE